MSNPSDDRQVAVVVEQDGLGFVCFSETMKARSGGRVDNLHGNAPARGRGIDAMLLVR
jgi:hypothetical protein